MNFLLKIGLRLLLSRINKYLKKADKEGKLDEVRENLQKYGGYLKVISETTGSAAKICTGIIKKLADNKLDKEEAQDTIDSLEALYVKIRNRLK